MGIHPGAGIIPSIDASLPSTDDRRDWLATAIVSGILLAHAAPLTIKRITGVSH
jgi:hypothetical protein